MKEQEFLDLLQNHSGIISKIVHLYVDDPEDKLDLKQEIMLQAWKSIKSFQGKSQFSTWLYRVSLNTALTFRRKDKSDRHTSLKDYDTATTAKSEHPGADLLYRCIKQLNDVDKTIVTLHLDGYDNADIADITGLTKNNTTVRLHRIKTHLSKQLKPKAHG